MTKVLSSLLILLTLTACKSSLSSSFPLEKDDNFLSSVRTTDDLKFWLKIKSEHIETLEDIKAQFKLKNISGKKLTYQFPSGCQYGFTITKNEETIFDSRKNLLCTAVLTQLKLKPSESVSFSINLDIFDIDKKIGKGVYELNAFLLEGNTSKIPVSFKAE